MKLCERTTAQRGATLMETVLCMVLVALVTCTAINRYGVTLSALLGRDLVGALGGKQVGLTAGIPSSDTPPTNPMPLIGGAQPTLGGGSSRVGGVPNMQASQLR